MEGIGSDKDRIIKEIVSHSNSFRQLIKEKYLSLFGKVKILTKYLIELNIYEWILLIKKRLEDEIKSETSGHFQDGVN